MTPENIALKNNIEGQKIKEILYSEVNDPKGDFYFNGYHVIDSGINIKMDDGFCWHFMWKKENTFKLQQGEYLNNANPSHEAVKTWNATDKWEKYLHSEIQQFDIIHSDDCPSTPIGCQLSFNNGLSLTLFIGEELHLDNTIPTPLKHKSNGELYIFFDENLLIRAAKKIYTPLELIK